MIPRTKVNYRLTDLLRASLVGEGSQTRRQALIGHLGRLFGTNHILLTASGRGGLYTLLSCLPQRRVVLPAYTCKAVVEAVRLAGKQAVFAESEDDGFNMSPHSLETFLDADTILLVTHQFGIPCDIRAMLRLARAAGAFVIEDAAASLGSRVDGQLTGSFGDAAFFSFDSTKLVNAPLKGGFLCIRDAALYQRCAAYLDASTQPMPATRKLRYLLLGGILVLLENPLLYRYFHNLKFRWRGRFTDDSVDRDPSLGPFYVERLAEWQAGILLPQIEGLEEIVATRQRLYADYLDKLQGVQNISLPAMDCRREWAPIRFPIRVPIDKMAFYRKSVRRGVDYAFSFTFIDCPADFTISHRLAATVLDLPFYHRLSAAELEQVVNVVRELDLAIQQGD
jgi:dTDP-4-amino-4,6-dideoxygalactose transaminase